MIGEDLHRIKYNKFIYIEMEPSTVLTMLSIIVLIIVIVFIMNSNTKLIENNIIVHADCFPDDMSKHITKVYHVYEAINKMCDRVLPITVKFSHWEVVIEVNNGHKYMVSSAHQGFVEIFATEYDPATRTFSYKWKRNTNKCYIINTYEVTKQINIIGYSHELNKFIHKAQTYDLLHNNCMHATSFGIVHILDIGYRPELDVDTNISNILKSIYDNFMKYKER